ncbi:MAG TPA: response regulator [Holophagaceae bacterium]|nr:response regulator [Holophagaceae bacterium]
MDPNPTKTVLVVDDDRVTRTLVSRTLTATRLCSVVSAGDGEEALEVLRTMPVDLLVTDLQMPRMGGFQLLAHLTTEFPAIPALVISGVLDDSKREKAGEMGAMKILAKPLRAEELQECVKTMLQREPDARFMQMNVLSLLTLIHWEDKTCTLTVQSRGRLGMLYLQSGRLIHATYKNREGRDVAFEILAWERPDVTMMETCKVLPSIEDPMDRFLEEARSRIQAN